MTTSEKTQLFFELETNNNFFDLETSDGIRYWDIIRYNVYIFLFFDREGIIPKKNEMKINIMHFLKKCKKIIIFFYKILTCRPKYIFFICSRNKDNEGKNIDIISREIVSKLPPDERLIIETYANGEGEFTYIHNTGLIIAKYLFLLETIICKNNSNNNYAVIDILADELDISTNDKKILRNIIDNDLKKYRIERKYYKRLFLLLRPEIIFLVQNGIQKGMFNAASFLKIPVVEFQHGFIGYCHPAYSYPLSIRKGQICDLPDYFFAFSPYWLENVNFPVKSIYYIGNNFYARKIEKKETKYNITFIMGAFSNHLFSLIEKLLEIEYTGKICIKLHPGQYPEYDSIVKQFKSATDIIILKNELSIPELLAITGCIITVDSTCIYEALHNDVRVLLLNVLGHELMQNIYENPLVKTINSAKDIAMMEEDHETKQQNKVIYFEEFSKNGFDKFMSEQGLW